MATQLWSTGPALIYIGTPGDSAGTAGFVGTCETKPQIDIDFLFKPVMNDLGGDVSMDEMFVGMQGMVTIDLNKFNYFVAEALATLPNTAGALNGTAGVVSGRNDPGDIGSLMFTEGLGFVLFILFPYAIKAAYGGGNGPPTGAGMVRGYRFPACKVNKQSIASGTTPHNKRFIIDCKRSFDPTVVNTYGAGRFILYDSAVAGLPTPS